MWDSIAGPLVPEGAGTRRSSVGQVKLDDTVSLAGAEGIDLDLVLAGIGSRSAALLIDVAVQFVALLVAGFVAVLFGEAGIASWPSPGS